MKAQTMETGHDATPPYDNRWTRIVKVFERVVVLFVMGLLMVIVALSALDLGWLLLRDLSNIRAKLLDVGEILELFGVFLLILVGLELLTSLKSYVREGVVQAEVVLEVSLIAIAQKIIILDTSKVTGLVLLGEAALVLALAAAYWMIR